MGSELRGKVLTVKGSVDPEKLGPTLIHEHVLFDLSCYYRPPDDSRGKALTDQQIQLSNLGWIRQNSMSSRPNLIMNDEDVAIREVHRFVELGGGTLVDQTVNGIAPNPQGLARVSQATEAHIVAGCGYYIHVSHPKDMDERTVDGLSEELVGNIEKGINDTPIRAGLIGEIGASWPLHPNEEKCIRAAALAHLQTGVAVSIHPGHDPESPMQVLNILRREGVKPERVIISHIENRYRERLDLYKALAETGCNLSFDCFARDLYFASVGRQHPSDDLRIEMIAALAKAGYGRQIMVAHDCCFRIDLATYGGHGYGHILENIVTRLERKGVPHEQISEILVENPKRFLTIQ